MSDVGASSRLAEVVRETRETRVRIRLDLDAVAPSVAVSTGLPIFDHFLQALGLHGRFGLAVEASGDLAVDPHHLVEDVGIVLGQAIRQAVGDHGGMERFGHQCLPMDEALVEVALDFSGRGRLYWPVPFPERAINQVSPEVWPEFFHGLAAHAGITLHVRLLAGSNAHHAMEAAFKALGRALYQATRRHGGGTAPIPSTKGVL